MCIILLAIVSQSFSVQSIYDPTPLPHEISVFAIGKVRPGVIMVEPPDGNWTVEKKQEALGIINKTLGDFESLAPHRCLDFLEPIVTYVSTSYNESFMGVKDDLWIKEVLNALGVQGTDWMNQMFNYGNMLRNETLYPPGADWSVLIFMVDLTYLTVPSLGNGHPAYAYLGGPAVVYGYYWGRSSLMLLHELAHCFWATDEYNGQTERSGYLWVEDNETAECVMNSFAYTGFCQATQEQLGWRDSDGDGIHDIVDNQIYTTIDQFWPNPTINKILRYTGVSVVIPCETPNPDFRDITITKVANVQFRVDNGTWFNATPTDGNFDYATEEFWFVTSALKPGLHTIEARGINTVGNMDEFYTKDTVRIVEGGPGAIPVANFTYSIETEDITVDQPIFFDASASSSDSSISSYTWDFDDGNTTSTIDPYVYHTYDSPGEFTVVLNVTNSQGLWNITTTLIAVLPITDLNKDGAVNILDISIVAMAFGTQEGDENYNSIADLDGNKEINIVDVSIVARDFGKTV